MAQREHSESVVHHLLAADTVLPEQFWESEHGSTNLSGERALMWAVFADGIDSYRRTAHATAVERQVEFNEVERWLLATDWDWPFSFVNLCGLFGFDPAGIREALLDWKHAQARRVMRRQRFRPIAQRAA